jgi:hypothetical protein
MMGCRGIMEVHPHGRRGNKNIDRDAGRSRACNPHVTLQIRVLMMATAIINIVAGVIDVVVTGIENVCIHMTPVARSVNVAHATNQRGGHNNAEDQSGPIGSEKPIIDVHGKRITLKSFDRYGVKPYLAGNTILAI